MADNHGVFREWSKRYLVEYLTALAVCIAASGFCIPLARAASSGITRIFFLTVPAAAILVIAIVVLRHFRRVDEFMRRLMVECFAVAGAFTLTWTLAYGVFEIAGLPKISMWWVFGGLALVWNLWMLRAVWR
jgi:hypothetical protein